MRRAIGSQITIPMQTTESWSDVVERDEADAKLAANEVVIHPEKRLVEDFFSAPCMPADSHEAWLLRLCATLMEREARAVSVAVAAARAAEGANTDRARRRGRRGGTNRWKQPSANGSDASTRPNMETD
jgi:hypothetical protein